MPAYTAPMSKLEAVNIGLSSIGEPPINVIDGSGIDAQIASDLIDETSRTVQLKGWWWNREKLSLSPDNNGKINLPGNTAKVDSIEVDKALDVVQRGLYLYNRAAGTFVFTSPVRLELVLILSFDDIPAAARDHIASKAAMRLQQRILGSDTIDKYLEQSAKESWMEMIRDETQSADPNMLRDNWSTFGLVQRGEFRRGSFQSGVY